MFRIRRIHDVTLPVDRSAVAAVQAILRAQFPDARDEDIEALPKKLVDPLKDRFRTIVFVAESRPGTVEACALLLHEPAIGFCWLDFISVAPGRGSGGMGGALYRAVKDHALALGAVGILMECLPDDPKLCRDPASLVDNRRRLRFYERFGARPIVGTAYETPVQAGGDCPPLLVFDPLRPRRTLSRDTARAAVRAVLERKYAWLCSPEYTERVVGSFTDDPVRLRPPRYGSPKAKPVASTSQRPSDPFVLLLNAKHEIHHIRERGYVESPARVRVIHAALRKTGLFVEQRPQRFGEQWLLMVHAPDYVHYFKRLCRGLQPDEAVYPYVFPVRNAARPPHELAIRAGYYCVDTFTPLTREAFAAARGAVDCALGGARALLEGTRVAYALVRPPGHHAERRYFGGFCYFNNAAIAAQYLAPHGRVAILDVDYHHGNGQQQIFYARSDVLTVSIHGHPSFAYPYFSGFALEKGEGDGRGYNLNLPLPERVDGETWRAALDKALARIRRFKADFLIVCLGLDTARADPTGTWDLETADFAENGARIGALHLPTLVVQEGGYGVKVLGRNAVAFFTGLRRADP